MAKLRLSKKARAILAIVLSVLIGVGAIFGVVAITKELSNKTKQIRPAFSVGGLDEETGKYVETDDTIYTKNLIECQGLIIEPKLDKEVDYQIFYYNYDGVFLDALDIKTSKYVRGGDYKLAKYCRIVIYPDMKEKTSDDFHVYFWEVLGYADDITVRVNREQNFGPEDLYPALLAKEAPRQDHVATLNDGYSYYLFGSFIEPEGTLYNFSDIFSNIIVNEKRSSVFKIQVPDVEYPGLLPSYQLINRSDDDLEMRIYLFWEGGNSSSDVIDVSLKSGNDFVFSAGYYDYICIEYYRIERANSYYELVPFVIYQYT